MSYDESTFTLDGRRIHYELHGEGPPALVMGGWGTFCHGGWKGLPRAVVQHHRTLIYDYPGIGDSTDDEAAPATTERYAEDVAALLDHLGWERVQVIGLVGMGACIGQQLALARPELVRSLTMTGTWARPDPIFTDQLEGLRRAHLEAGFDTFQLLVASFSFTPEFYNANRDRLIGPDGSWAALRGREEAHSRLIDACLSHDTVDRLAEIACPCLVVHAGRDVITRPDMTQLLEDGIPDAQGYHWEEIAHVIAGREDRARFDQILTDFLSEVPA